MARRLAVLGSPIDHSKSPAIHNAAYRVLGLDWQYDKSEVREGGLRDFVSTLDDSWLGLSLTMPLKEEGARFAGELDSYAQKTSAANTLLRTSTGWNGYNTDVFGIIQAIKQSNVTVVSRILVIGSGATATSALVAIAEIAGNAEVLVFARNEATRDELISFGVSLGLQIRATTKLRKACQQADLVLSTLPAHALDEVAERLAKLVLFKPKGAVFDVVYKDWPTNFAKLWLRAGRPAISGLEMLIWQAVAQIRIFSTGDPQQVLPNEVAVLEAMRHTVSD